MYCGAPISKSAVVSGRTGVQHCQRKNRQWTALWTRWQNPCVPQIGNHFGQATVSKADSSNRAPYSAARSDSAFPESVRGLTSEVSRQGEFPLLQGAVERNAIQKPSERMPILSFRYRVSPQARIRVIPRLWKRGLDVCSIRQQKQKIRAMNTKPNILKETAGTSTLKISFPRKPVVFLDVVVRQFTRHTGPAGLGSAPRPTRPLKMVPASGATCSGM